MFCASSIMTTVSTHSRPKAAGAYPDISLAEARVSTHSRPKAAGAERCDHIRHPLVSTHSRPKAAEKLHKLEKEE